MGVSEPDENAKEVGEDHGQAELTEELSHQPARERDRQEDRDVGQVAGQHRDLHLAGAAPRRLQRRLASFQVATDILVDDDGVVDEQPDGNRQGQQR